MRIGEFVGFDCDGVARIVELLIRHRTCTAVRVIEHAIGRLFFPLRIQRDVAFLHPEVRRDVLRTRCVQCELHEHLMRIGEFVGFDRDSVARIVELLVRHRTCTAIRVIEHAIGRLFFPLRRQLGMQRELYIRARLHCAAVRIRVRKYTVVVVYIVLDLPTGEAIGLAVLCDLFIGRFDRQRLMRRIAARIRDLEIVAIFDQYSRSANFVLHRARVIDDMHRIRALRQANHNPIRLAHAVVPNCLAGRRALVHLRRRDRKGGRIPALRAKGDQVAPRRRVAVISAVIIAGDDDFCDIVPRRWRH